LVATNNQPDWPPASRSVLSQHLTLDPRPLMIMGPAGAGNDQIGLQRHAFVASAFERGRRLCGCRAKYIAIAGVSLLANAGQNAPAVELCLHDVSSTPEVPPSKPDLSDCTHCIFCFAGAHDAVIGTEPAIFHRVNIAMLVAPWLGDQSGLTRPTRYTIASPRGPPLSA
jgi:hypothetical protein